jgi:tripartite-type tricarboxylate transporter receptor subunit TctC
MARIRSRSGDIFDGVEGGTMPAPAGTQRRLWAIYTILALLAAPLLSGPACAQDFPTRPIRIIVGPSPDVFARIVGEHLQQAWGQPVVVEPRPGGGGKLAAAAVAGAEADGHTLLFATPTYTLNAAMKLASHDLVKDFEAVSLIGLISYALVVNPRVEARSVAELVALAKARPGKLNCGSAGIGTVPHIACETLNKAAGISIVHVPYRDVNAAMMGTVGGTVDMFVGVSTTAKAQIEAGTVRGLAVTTAQRSLLLPRLPTLIEAGFPDIVMPGWGGLLAPARTPPAIVQKLNAEIALALQKPEVRARLLAVGMETPPALAPAGVADFIRADVARWTGYVEAVGLDKLKDGANP